MDRDRFERTHTHRLRRQDVCCTGTGKPAPYQHHHLFAFGSTYLALRGLPSLPRPDTKARAASKGRRAAAPPGYRCGMSDNQVAEKKKNTYATRPRKEDIKVFVTEYERAEPLERAAQAGMSQSAFC